LKGFGDAAVREVSVRHDGAVYTVRFGEVVYVLHVFQKKSKRGIATPKKALELIRKRLNRQAGPQTMERARRIGMTTGSTISACPTPWPSLSRRS
jgi:Phage derived protein Gp49-like (DUF891)